MVQFFSQIVWGHIFTGSIILVITPCDTCFCPWRIPIHCFRGPQNKHFCIISLSGSRQKKFLSAPVVLNVAYEYRTVNFGLKYWNYDINLFEFSSVSERWGLLENVDTVFIKIGWSVLEIYYKTYWSRLQIENQWKIQDFVRQLCFLRDKTVFLALEFYFFTEKLIHTKFQANRM